MVPNVSRPRECCAHGCSGAPEPARTGGDIGRRRSRFCRAGRPCGDRRIGWSEELPRHRWAHGERTCRPMAARNRTLPRDGRCRPGRPADRRKRARLDRATGGLGYTKVAGNRFSRTINDVPVVVTGARESPLEAIIDVLIPAYTSRARPNRRVGDQLVTTEVLGLTTALNRAPVVLTLELHRLNGDALDVELSFPDEVAALVLKGFATRVRVRATDVVDVWRAWRWPSPRESIPRRSLTQFQRKAQPSCARCLTDRTASG